MRYFSMVFDGGFKLSTSSHELIDVMQKVERVHIMECATPVDAYVQAYNEYQARSGGATVSTYEEMLTRPLFFSPVIDHEKLGFVLTTIIGVRVKGGKLKNWEEKTFFNKNVVGIYDVTGEYDAFLIAKFRNTNELNAFIKELLKDPIIERTYTQTVLDVIKEDMGSSNIL